jgi:hypothetical protein
MSLWKKFSDVGEEERAIYLPARGVAGSGLRDLSREVL